MPDEPKRPPRGLEKLADELVESLNEDPEMEPGQADRTPAAAVARDAKPMEGTRAVELTESENALIARIDFKPSLSPHDYEAVLANSEAPLALAKSLLARKAIPEPRRRWFEDSACNIGGRGDSRQDAFAKKGIRGDDMFRHPHFRKYLRYFVYGPDLPATVLDGFAEKVSGCGTVTSGDIIPLGEYAKQQTRAHGLDGGRAAEEFYKLALECGLDEYEARSIRHAVKTARR
jgi:hypothetical protein